jgi:hypothetical protein
MVIPVYVVVAQWALLLALGALVAILYRHVGRAMAKTAPTELGPPVGSEAASFEYWALSDKTLRQVRPGGGQAALVAFVEPSCLSCEQLVATMGTARESGELSGLRVLLLVSEPPRYVDLSEAFRGSRLEVGRVVARATVLAYKVSATPLLVAIDGDGVVRSAGPARDIAEVRAAIQACLTPPPSLPISVSPSGSHQAADTRLRPGATAMKSVGSEREEGVSKPNELDRVRYTARH